jgi:hypothetical protein
MKASCPTDETERTARGGSWTVACAWLFAPLTPAQCLSILAKRWQRAVGWTLLGPGSHPTAASGGGKSLPCSRPGST